MGGGGAREIEAVSAHSNADTVFFGLVWSYGCDLLGVCDFATTRDGGFFYKEDSVDAGRHAGTNTLGKAS